MPDVQISDAPTSTPERDQDDSCAFAIAEVRRRGSHVLKCSLANREWTPMHANQGVKALMASDSRLFAFIRGFRLNNHSALTSAGLSG
jgi:hypothetical protein